MGEIEEITRLKVIFASKSGGFNYREKCFC